MATEHLAIALEQLQRLVRAQPPTTISDAELLERFVRIRDQAAFEVLLWRHGPMVLALCHRLLRDSHAAEDAFQATFLVLAQKAMTIGQRRSVGSWLYKVAYRVAQRARQQFARRPSSTSNVSLVAAPPEHDASLSQERHSLLDDAIQRLPERYRVPVVLCYMQGKRIREAAAELGCPTATISTRLRRARALLERQLKQRGVAVLPESGAALAARLLHAPIPGRLANKALHLALGMSVENGLLAGGASQVIALARGAARAMLLAKVRAAGVLVAGVVLLMAAGGAAIQLARAASAKQPPTAMAAPRAAPANNPVPHKEAAPATGVVAVSGRVLGPDSKPLAGASLYTPHFRRYPPLRTEDVEMTLRAKTAADGRYRFELPASDRPSQFRVQIVASAPGYGCDWRDLAETPPDNLDLKLVKDQPIRGRVVDTEGKPLAGARVAGMTLFAPASETLDAFLRAWKLDPLFANEQLPKRLFMWPPATTAQTDADGRFEMHGVGAERFAKITIEGAGMAKALLDVVNRPGFDPVPYNRAGKVTAAMAEADPNPSVATLLAPTFECVAERNRVIEGTVRDADTHEPLGGVSISGGSPVAPIMVFTTSNAAGHYRLLGLGKAAQYTLGAATSEKGPWLRWDGNVADSGGLEPIHFDISIPRGAILRGRVVDRTTGKGVATAIRIVPLPDNRFFNSRPGYDVSSRNHLWSGTDADGTFEIATIPGSSVVLVNARVFAGELNGLPLNRYTLAKPDASDRKRLAIRGRGRMEGFVTPGGGFELMSEINGYKCLDAPEKGDARECIVYVDPGRTASIEIEDPDGKPLPGTYVSGLTAMSPTAFPLTEPRCTVYGLDSAASRTVLFYHKARKLAAALEVRGDEGQPVHVRLAPTGAVTGRVLDPEGKALARVSVELLMSDSAGELFRLLGEPAKRVITENDGRFRLDGLVPNSDFGLVLRRGKNPLRLDRRIGSGRVSPGATLDLGDIRSK
jgi:RNA polymerase sigma factor (sigma-70 family)